jgi:arylsulfatase A-like enzyme
MSEQEKSAEVPAEQSYAEKLKELLSEFPNHPDESVIESWKQSHSDVFCSALSETELFVFRALTRQEHRELQAAAETDEDYEDGAVRACLLWASIDNLDQKAGTLPTLLEQIMQNSNFMPPQLAGSLVVKL